ncbi:SRPBCC family protein [Geodermatophilus sp. SYSU D01105]
MSGDRAPVGLTRDAGWEIGVSRTVDLPVDQVWAFLTSAEGTRIWLGPGVERLDQRAQAYETADGTVGQVRSVRPGDRIRLTWHPEGWDHDSTVQVTVTSNGRGGTAVRFHQERLTSAQEREEQRAHWRAVMAALVDALERRA